MALRAIGSVGLPSHTSGGFDHGDVHLASGRVFVAHTSTGAIEVIDGERVQHIGTAPGCPEASGVLCAQEAGLVFALLVSCDYLAPKNQSGDLELVPTPFTV